MAARRTARTWRQLPRVGDELRYGVEVPSHAGTFTLIAPVGAPPWQHVPLPVPADSADWSSAR